MRVSKAKSLGRRASEILYRDGAGRRHRPTVFGARIGLTYRIVTAAVGLSVSEAFNMKMEPSDAEAKSYQETKAHSGLGQIRPAS